MTFGKPFGPMLLTEIKNPFDDNNYLYELKFDGFRAIIHVGPNTFKIFSRRGYDITNQYPELKKIKELVKKNTIFDGEIVSFTKNVPDFSKLQKRGHLKDKDKIHEFSINDPVCFVAFDILYQEKDLTKLPLLKRKELLSKIDNNDFFIKTEYILEQGKKLFKKIQEKNLEGIVAKKIDSIYFPDTRSKEWIKIKNFVDKEFFVGGYKESKSGLVVTLYLGEYQNNNFKLVGKVTLGKNNPFYQNVISKKTVTKSPFINFSEKDIVYLKPTLKCEVTYLEKTTNGLRHPIFKRGKNEK